MAVELTNWRKQPGDTTNQYQISAFADAKSDVAPGMKIKNVPSDWEIQPGSTIMTPDGEIAFKKSNGKWHWSGEEGDIDV